MKLQPTPSDVFRPLPPFDRPATKPNNPRIAPLKALFAGLALAVVAAGCAASGAGSLAPHHRSGSNIARALPAVSPTPAPAEGQSCDDGNGDAACHVQKNPNVGVSQTPSSGLTPAQLRSAYGLTPAAGGPAPTGPLVAIVDAYEDKNAES